MENEQNNLENNKNLSFMQLLKLKIKHQSDLTSKILNFITIFLSLFIIFIINVNYITIGIHGSKLSGSKTNFGITLLLMFPYIFISMISYLLNFLSKDRKFTFLAKTAIICSYITFGVLIFFFLFILILF